MAQITCSAPVVNSNFKPLSSNIGCPMLHRTFSAFLDYFRAMTFKIFSAVLLFFCAAGCGTIPPMPQVNLAEPGWKVREGQAVWQAHSNAGIAGDLTVATRGSDDTFLQFSKGPFPILVAQTTPSFWKADFPAQGKRYGGHGAPPNRLIFLLLPRVLSGQPPPQGWSWRVSNDNSWRLENQATGESLEGYLNP